MKRVLKNPRVNAAGLTVFSAFYALVFLLAWAQGAFAAEGHGDVGPFWNAWAGFLTSDRQFFLMGALLVMTSLIVLLLFRRPAYDEYHAGLLKSCLAVAAVLTLFFIAAFFLLVVLEPERVLLKFALFIDLHWTSVVLADLFYVLACRWR